MPGSLIFWRFAIAFGVVYTVGCAGVRTPNFAQPGTAAQQRADAERFDPYPDPYAGPEVVGGRPLGYTRPLTDTGWAERYGRRAVPLVPTAPPVMTTVPGANPFAAPPPAFTTAAPPVTTGPPPTFSPPYSSPVVPMTPVTPAAPSSQPIRPRSPY